MKLVAILSILGFGLGCTITTLAQAVETGHQPAQPEVQVKVPSRGSFAGIVSDGVADGMFSNGDRYRGGWKNGKPEGYGTMTYMLGGAYEGEWKNGRRDGRGILTFAGSGRRAALRFVDDRREDVAPDSPSTATSSDMFWLLADEEPVGSHIRKKVTFGPLPLDRGFDELTPDQQRFVRSYYPALDAGDTPPYPVTGGKELYKLLVALIRHSDFKEDILIYVAVDADANVTSVTSISPLSLKLKNFIGAAAGLLKYKPAQCGGQPCPGVVPFNLKLLFNY